jgi:hypothetical protein
VVDHFGKQTGPQISTAGLHGTKVRARSAGMGLHYPCTFCVPLRVVQRLQAAFIGILRLGFFAPVRNISVCIYEPTEDAPLRMHSTVLAALCRLFLNRALGTEMHLFLAVIGTSNKDVRGWMILLAQRICFRVRIELAVELCVGTSLAAVTRLVKVTVGDT